MNGRNLLIAAAVIAVLVLLYLNDGAKLMTRPGTDDATTVAKGTITGPPDEARPEPPEPDEATPPVRGKHGRTL
jgi:hypothetical protein